MGKTYRRNSLDKEFGCFEDYMRRSGYARRGLVDLDDEDFDDWGYQFERKRWSQRRRDGKSGRYNYVSGGNKFFRELTNNLVRNGTRQAIHRGLETGDWDDLIFPTDWEGKQFIWTVW
jgi:hypothetical protein